MKRKFVVLDPMKSHRSTVMSRLGLLTFLSMLLAWVGVAAGAVSKDAGVILINQAAAVAGGSRRVTQRVSLLPFVSQVATVCRGI
jgi:hypothetical protein